MKMRCFYKKCISFCVLCAVVLSVTACAAVDVLDYAAKTAQETLNAIQTYETEPEAVTENHQPFTKENVKEWILGQIYEGVQKASVTFENHNVAEGDIFKTIRQVADESVEYQYLCSRYKVSCSYSSESIFCDFTFYYREKRMDARKIKRVKNAKQLYQHIVNQNSKGKDTVTFSYKKEKITKKKIQDIVETTFWNDAENLVITPNSWNTVFYGSKKTDYYIACVTYNYSNVTKKERKQAKEQVNKQIDKIVKKVKKKVGSGVGNNRATYKAINDVLCWHISYDKELADVLETGNENDPLRNNRSAYGALVKKKTVCSGYTAAFKAVCDAMSLPCWSLAGTTDNANHAWNVVICNKKVYYIDVTFADQETYISDRYFFANASEYKGWKRKVFKSVYVPQAFYKAGYKSKTTKG